MPIISLAVLGRLALPHPTGCSPFPVDLQRQFGMMRFLSGAPVAQLDRASDFESAGRRFDSCRAYLVTEFNSGR